MKHDPKIVHCYPQSVTNLFALQTVNLSERERIGGPLWQWREAIVKNVPKIVLLDKLSRTGVPLARRKVAVPVVGPFV